MVSIPQAAWIRNYEDPIEERKPFGGIQLIVSGDFFQLPSIENKGAASDPYAFRNRFFAFESPAWQRCRFECVLLTHVSCTPSGTFPSALSK